MQIYGNVQGFPLLKKTALFGLVSYLFNEVSWFPY